VPTAYPSESTSTRRMLFVDARNYPLHVRFVITWLVLIAATLGATIGLAYGFGVLFMWAFSPSMSDGHATAASISDAFYFVVGAIVGGAIGLALCITTAVVWGVRRANQRAG
jgi:hypothetical protein